MVATEAIFEEKESLLPLICEGAPERRVAMTSEFRIGRIQEGKRTTTKSYLEHT